MSSFEVKYGNGETYKKYASLESRFTQEFKDLTFNLMVEVYIRDQMRRKGMPDREFVHLQNTWSSVASELGVLRDYPYDMKIYAPAHPYAKAVAVEGKKRLGFS